MNSVILSGNLTNDPTIKSVGADNKTMATFTLAHNRGKDDVNFFDCVAFDKKAELIRDYCKKGNKILIRGELKQDVWNAQDGSKRSQIRVVVQEVEFLSKNENKGQNESQEAVVEDKSVQPSDLPF